MQLLLILPVLIFSIVVHEVAHGWVALHEGDNTAYMLGRLTLNPVPHIDLFGSILVPLLLWFMHAPLFGWAKPVPVNPRNFRRYKRGDLLVSVAGITANILLAIAFTVLTAVFVYLIRLAPALAPSLSLLQEMVWYGVFINLILAFFNLIPIPPLDGSHLLYYLLPTRLAIQYRQVGGYGMLILFAVLFFLPGVVNIFLWPAMYLQGLARVFITAVT